MRIIGVLEGISYIILLYASIVLKRMKGDDDAIFIPGIVHGILFVLYCVALWHTVRVHGRQIKWAIKFFVAALLPFGPFMVDQSLKRELDELPTDE